MLNININKIIEGNQKATWTHSLGGAISDEALDFIKDFIKYAELYPDEMASVMWYDIDGFKSSVKLLKEQLGIR